MGIRIYSLTVLAIGAGLIGNVSTATGQLGYSGVSGSTSTRPSPFGTGPLGGNPAYNPFLNPMVMPYTTNPDVMWYLYATGQYYGSSIPGTQGGRLNGSPPAPSAADPSASTKPGNSGRNNVQPKTPNARRPGSRLPAEMPLSAATPGASAAGYFFRGPSSRSGAGRYFNRPLNNFQNNGR